MSKKYMDNDQQPPTFQQKAFIHNI